MKESARPRVGAEEFRLLVESVKDYAIFMLDTEGRIITWNKGARDFKGYEADEMRGKFIAHAAHELRTPVSVIVGFISYLLESGTELPPEFAEIVAALGRQGSRMHTLVNNLLDLTQLEHGRMSFDLGSARVDSAIEHVLHLAPPPRGQMVRLDLEPLVVLADADRLEQIFMNLLTNSYRYGGPNIEIAAREDGSFARIDVSDDGPGVAPASIEELFEPFHRGPDTAMLEGSGLGLTIVRGLVEAFNGSVSYVAEEPGARFVIRIPRAES